MHAGEEYLFSIGTHHVWAIYTIFKLVNPGIHPVNLGIQPVNLRIQPVNLGIHPVKLGIHPVNLGIYLLVLAISAYVEGRDELDTAFVERQCMAEVRDSIV